MMQDKLMNFTDVLIASQSYIDTLDKLKGTELYNKDIKILVDQLLNKLQSRFKKQFKEMFSEENMELVKNMLKDYEKFNKFSIQEKQILTQMTEYYIEDPDFWKENFVLFFEKLNKK